MSWDDAHLEASKPPIDHRARLTARVGTLNTDELRLLEMLVERILSRRHQPDHLEVDVPRDAAGDVAAAVELSVDLALAATKALTWARRQQT